MPAFSPVRRSARAAARVVPFDPVAEALRPQLAHKVEAPKEFYIETLMADATLTESTLISRMSDRIEKCCTVAAKAIRDYIPEYIGLVREGSADTIAQQMLSLQGNVFVPPLAAKS